MIECWCHYCEDDALEGMDPFTRMHSRRFIVCPDCGNKRCPKATFHELTCTRSNEPGQKGSVYE